MRFNCYCQKGFNLSLKEARLVSTEFDLFCSPSCFLKYINDLETTKILAKRYQPVVSQAFECWDDVTRSFYRSMYEVYFARFLVQNGIEFKYEPHSIKVEGKHYTPDFWIPAKDVYIECKGRWGSGARAKTVKASKVIPLILLPSYLQREFTNAVK